MPNTKVRSISPTVICANGDFEKLKTMLAEQIKLNQSTRLFVPLGPLAIRNALAGKISENQQIARMQRIVQLSTQNGLKVISAYDAKHARKGQTEMNQKPKGSTRSNFEIEYDKIVGDYNEGNSGNSSLDLLFGKKLYYTKLAAIDSGLQQLLASHPDEKTLVVTKPYFAAYVMEVLRVPTKNYHGVSPHGAIPPMPRELVQAKRYLEILKNPSKAKRAPKKVTLVEPKLKLNKSNSKRTIPLNRRHGRR
ncbi:MAG: hypothetical protein WC915_01950 [archaeon]|jgi:hypothetical protein